MTLVKQDVAPARSYRCRSLGEAPKEGVDSLGMDFAWRVLRDGTTVITSLGLRRTGLHSGTAARREAEEQVILSGFTGPIEIEVGTLVAGTVCVDRRPFVDARWAETRTPIPGGRS